MRLFSSPILTLALSVILTPPTLAQNVHVPSCSATTNFGDAVDIITYAVGESQLIAEAALQTMRNFQRRNRDRTTPMTYEALADQCRISGTIYTYLGMPGDDTEAWIAREQAWRAGLKKFTARQWDIQGQDNPLIVCENGDWFPRETTYVDDRGRTQNYMLDGQPSFRYIDKVNNAAWDIGYAICDGNALTTTHAVNSAPFILICGKGLKFARTMGNYHIGDNYRRDFSTEQWAGTWQRNINAWGWSVTGMLMHELWHALVGLRDVPLDAPVTVSGLVTRFVLGYAFEGSTALLSQNPAGVIDNVDSFNWLTIALYLKATLFAGQWAFPLGANIPEEMLSSLSGGSKTRRVIRGISAGRL